MKRFITVVDLGDKVPGEIIVEAVEKRLQKQTLDFLTTSEETIQIPTVRRTIFLPPQVDAVDVVPNRFHILQDLDHLGGAALSESVSRDELREIECNL